MGHFWASVHVGVRFKAQVHHHGDGPGLLGAAISKAVFLTERNDAVSRTRRWMSLPTNFLAIDGFSRFQLMAPWTRLPLVISVSVTQPVVRSPSRKRSPAAHRPRHSPKVDAARPPASALPLPRLSSLRSFHHARTAAARSFVSRCRVQTVPRYSAHSPPTACAASCLQLC